MTPKYNPLGQQEIRLLSILPGIGGEPVQCSLRHTDIDDAQSTYIALSYTWGPPTDAHHPIKLDGRDILVRHNLYYALLSLRKRDIAHPFWIDMLCINQEDVLEKNAQIPMMAQIYSQAIYVLIWLGTPENDSDYIFQAIHDSDSSKLKSVRFFIAWSRLIERPWFTRTWILQEFALHLKSPSIFCGDTPIISWDQFDAADPTTPPSTYHAFSGEEQAKVDFETMNIILTNRTLPLLANVRRKRHEESYDNSLLVSALGSTLFCSATDPRDRIYGILALVRPEIRAQIVVDYSKSVKEVFTEAMINILFHPSRLLPEAYALRIPLYSREEGSGIPSWVFNFNPPPLSRLHWSELHDIPASMPLTVEPFKLRGTALQARGVYLGTVSQVVTANFPYKTPISDRRIPRQTVMEDELDLLIGLKGRYLDNRNILSFLLEVTFQHSQMHSADAMTWKTLVSSRRAQEELSDEALTTEAYQMLLELAAEMRSDYPLDDVNQFFPKLIDAKAQLTQYLRANPLPDGLSPDDQEKLIDRNTSILHDLRADNMFSHIQNVPAKQFKNNNSERLLDNLRAHMNDGRCFFTCDRDWFGISNPGAQAGDEIVLLFPHVHLPFVLRPCAEGHEMIALAYLPLEHKKRGEDLYESEVQDFFIV
jgi:hypothetical protein